MYLPSSLILHYHRQPVWFCVCLRYRTCQMYEAKRASYKAPIWFVYRGLYPGPPCFTINVLRLAFPVAPHGHPAPPTLCTPTARYHHGHEYEHLFWSKSGTSTYHEWNVSHFHLRCLRLINCTHHHLLSDMFLAYSRYCVESEAIVANVYQYPTHIAVFHRRALS